MTGFERSTQTMSRDTSGCFEPRRSLRSLRQLSPVASQSRSARSAIWFRISACLILYASPTSRVISLIAVSFVTKSHVRQRALPRRFGFAVAENFQYICRFLLRHTSLEKNYREAYLTIKFQLCLHNPCILSCAVLQTTQYEHSFVLFTNTLLRRHHVRYWHDLRRHRRALAQRAPVGRLVDLRHRTLSLQASLEPTHP